MARKLTIRQLTLSILALWHDRSLKEVGAAAGISQKRVSQLLRRGEVREEVFERLVAALGCPRASVSIVTSCLEALDAQEKAADLTPEEQAEIEETVLRAGRVIRETLTEAARLSRAPSTGSFPQQAGAAPARRQAGELWERLRGLAPEIRAAVVEVARQFQTWALCERVCDESARAASRNVKEAADLARLARKIADRVPGPEGFRLRLQGYSAGHEANAFRVAGKHPASEAALAEAWDLWRKGSDPGGVLDPGRLLDLEASLRKDQRRLGKALALLKEAAAVGRHPERALIKKGITLEKMGEPERAVEALRQADLRLDRQADPRQGNILDFNLAVNLCHLGRCREAAELLSQIRSGAIETGDELAVLRMTWLEGRIASGLGRTEEALELLRQARREFAAREMGYDVALALLEEAVVLLEQGRTADVKALTPSLALVFYSGGVHPEALAALRLFQEAAEREEATADLARRVLRYLFRARHNQSLRFTS